MKINLNFNKTKEKPLSYILKQYELLVGTTEGLLNRRVKKNGFFIILNTFIFTFTHSPSVSFLGSSLPHIFGIVLCLYWLKIIKDLSLINKIKFDILEEIERNYLPLSIFEEEYQKRKEEIKNRGKNNFNISLTYEKIIFIFIILHFLALLFSFYKIFQ